MRRTAVPCPWPTLLWRNTCSTLSVSELLVFMSAARRISPMLLWTFLCITVFFGSILMSFPGGNGQKTGREQRAESNLASMTWSNV